MTEYLTTKELAALLRIKERKVYDLAASGRVPVSKAMGKLLFPRAEIEAWIARGQVPRVAPDSGSKRTTRQTQRQNRPREPDATSRANVVVGSHDPLLEWALRESGSGLATYFDGSGDGLMRLAAGEGIAAGLHLYDANLEAWNTATQLGPLASAPFVLMEWAKRSRGIVSRLDQKPAIASLDGITGLRRARRQPGAGAEVLLDALVKTGPPDRRRRTKRDDDVSPVVVRTETDAALAVLDGRADVAFGLETHARQMGLAFVPVINERFDLLVERRAWFEPSWQTFLKFCSSDAFRAQARTHPGYDCASLGAIHFNGP
ncbi:MAG: helix-turn-helix transcriptional regulator [Pseudomonadota bacterium]